MEVQNQLNLIIFLIFGMIIFGPVYKGIQYLRYIISIDKKIDLNLPKKVDEFLNYLIMTFSIITPIYYTIFGLDTLFYVLLVGTFYFIILKFTTFISNTSIYYLIIIFPIIGLLGYISGKVSGIIKSPPILEIFILWIFFMLPYIDYKLFVNDKKLDKIINEYYILFNKISNDQIYFIVKDIRNSINWIKELNNIENIIKENLLSFRLEFKVKKQNMNKNKYKNIKFKTSHLNWFINLNDKPNRKIIL